MSQIVYCCGISEDINTITQIFVSEKSELTEITGEAGQILENLADYLPNDLDRKNIDSENYKNRFWVTTKNNSVATFALISEDYPQRVGYKLLKELSALYEDYETKKNFQDLKKNGKKLLKKYNSPEKIDKLMNIHSKVNGLKNDLEANMNKLIDGNENLEDLEEESNHLRKRAKIFDKKTKEVEKVMCWKRFRMYFYLLAFVAFIIACVFIYGHYYH